MLRMRAEIKLTMAKLSVIVILSSALAISAINCLPSQPQASTLKVSSIPPTTTSASTSKLINSTPTTIAPKVSPLTSANNSPSLVDVKNSIPAPGQNLAAIEAFDGKNPFADDSLWQIPIHLVRDLSANGDDQHHQTFNSDNMAKSASERAASEIDSDDDDDLAISQQNPTATVSQSSSSSPTVISATTDLKTAAGYHYPSHGGHHDGYYGGHHDGYSGGHSGHHGGHHGEHSGYHHGVGDHHGKYFQYASVPYPYTWEFGYRRGNPYHTIERYEHGKGPHFKTKVKWSDKNGYGVHVWDYNHDDHHSHHYGGHDHYDSHGPSHYGGHHNGGHYGHH